MAAFYSFTGNPHIRSISVNSGSDSIHCRLQVPHGGNVDAIMRVLSAAGLKPTQTVPGQQAVVFAEATKVLGALQRTVTNSEGFLNEQEVWDALTGLGIRPGTIPPADRIKGTRARMW